MASGRKAARVGDNHFCPLVSTTWIFFDAPHKGGKLDAPGILSVRINGMAAAAEFNATTCETGDKGYIAQGVSEVTAEGMPLTRQWEVTSHGGFVTSGSYNVLIGTLSAEDWIRLAIARLKASAWGQTDEGKRVIAQLEAMQADGKISTGPTPPGTAGFYNPADKSITVNQDTETDVDATASNLAHEGTHAADDADRPDDEHAPPPNYDSERRAFDNETDLYKEQHGYGYNDQHTGELMNPATRGQKIRDRYGFPGASP